MMKIPGFIDLQVNGYKGVGFSNIDLTEADFCFACEALLENGTAAFLPTIITSSRGVYARILPLIAKAAKTHFNGSILGIHLEGPFISDQPGSVGAHSPADTQKPSAEFFDELWELSEGGIKLLTIAAELEGAEDLIAHAMEKGVVVSLGHQMAGYDQVKTCHEAGAGAITHLGNGMPNQVPRHQNQIMTGLAIKKLKAMIITDGHHLPEQVIRAIFNAKEVADVIVTSDASPIAGCKPGRYNVFGNETVLEENGYLHNPKKQCMVGSSATLLECMNHLASLEILSVEDLLEVGFHNPLKLMGVEPDSIKSQSVVEWDEENKKFRIATGGS